MEIIIWVAPLLVNVAEDTGILVAPLVNGMVLAVAMIPMVQAISIVRAMDIAQLNADRATALIGLIEAVLKVVVPQVKYGEPEPVLIMFVIQVSVLMTALVIPLPHLPATMTTDIGMMPAVIEPIT